MALQGFSVALGSFDDSPHNYLPNTNIEIRKDEAGEPLATIYADRDGLTPIAQPGAKTNSEGVFIFYAEAGQYLARHTIDAQIFSTPVGSAEIDHSQTLNRNDEGAHIASAIQMASGATAEDAINEGRTSTKMTSAILKDPDTLPSDHILLQSRVGPFRAHMEPDRPIENGTVTKLDWMLDPYDASAILPPNYPAPNFNYRIFNVYTKTGNAAGLNGENGAACIGTKNRADGNTWGIFTSVHYGFNDCAVTWGKAYYFDTSDSAWRTPMKNFWYETKPVDSGDHVLWNGVLYQAQNTGNCGPAAPTHSSGTVSDGVVNWLFIRDFKLYSSAIKPVMLFGTVDKMPRFGFPTCGTQHATDSLFWNGVLQRFETVSGAQGGYIGIPAGESTLAIGAGSSLYRFSSTALYPSTSSQSLGRGSDPFSAAHINTLRVYGQSGFNGSAAIAKPTVTGSRGGNAALASLLTALANYGLITDNTTA